MITANTAKLKQISISGVPLLLFLTTFFLHTIYAFYMVITVPYWYTIDSGQIDRLIYMPVMWLFSNPFYQHTAMLMINGFLASLIPVIAYKIAAHLGVQKVRQRVLVAVVSGIYPAVIAHTKLFTWIDGWGNETFAFLFPCVIALIMLTAADAKSVAFRRFLSVVLALTVVTAVFANSRMAAVALALILTIIFSRIVLKKQIVSILIFVISKIMIVVAFLHIGRSFSNPMMFPSLDTLNFYDLLKLISGHLYYFTISTWGLGILGLCLFVRNMKAQDFKNEEDNLYKATKQAMPVIFSMFAFGAVLFSLPFSFSSGYDYSQEILMFGKYIDSITPLVLISVVCYIFLHKLDLRGILSAVIVTGLIFTAFFALSAGTVVKAKDVYISPILGLYPLRIGEAMDSLITFDGLFLMVSTVFCLMALFIVIVCCGGRYQLRIIAATIAVISLYSCIYVCAVYLPYEREQIIEYDAPIYEASDLLYNFEDAPPIVIHAVSGRTEELLIFLNQRVEVLFDYDEDTENYFLIMPKDAQLDDEGDNLVMLLGKTERYAVYAVGEKAIMYVQSQQN